MPVFTANVPGPLKIGDRIEIWGKIKDNARKMSVNLCAQEGEEPRDVVLHFDVRFHRDNIISLSRKNGVWIGSGNYDTNYNMFVPGTIFRIIFEIKDTDVITIYCQGKFHSNFLPKIPLSMAKYLVAWADIDRITHCYFHLANLKSAAGDEASPQQGLYPPASPRPTAVPGDIKQCHRMRTKTSPHGHTSDSSEEDGDVKLRLKTEGRADRYFYDTLMCKSPEYKFTGSPDSSKLPKRTEYSRKYPIRTLTLTDTEKNESEDCSEEVASQDMCSSVTLNSEDMLPEVKKHGKRSKFHFSQVKNFMGKNYRKN